MKAEIAEHLEMNGEAFLAIVDKKLGAYKAEIQPSDFWVGGEPGGWTNDSNEYFQSSKQAEEHYDRIYDQVYVFDNEYDAEEKTEELYEIYG